MGQKAKKNISAQNVENGEFDRADVKGFLKDFEPITAQTDSNNFNFTINISGADTSDEKELDELRELAKSDFEDEPEDISSWVQEKVTETKDAIEIPKIHALANKLGIKTAKPESFLNSFVIEKDASDQWRWIGWVSNNFKDRDKEILTDSAHKDYIEWLDENADLAPVLLVWHTAGTNMEKEADFWMYEDGFVTMSGILSDEEAQGFMKAADEEPLGMSHGFFVLERDPDNKKNITKYRTYEVSVLPLSKAANPWTNIQAVIKEVATMSGKKTFLAKILGDEKAEAFIERTGLMQTELRQAEIDEKETETPVEEVQETETKGDEEEISPEIKQLLEPLTKTTKEAVIEELGIEKLSEWVTKADEQFADLSTVLKAILEKMEQAEKTEEERLADLIAPPVKKKMAWVQPSKADDNVLDPNKKQDKELQDKAPGLPEDAWLSKATGTTPVMADA